jgi:hypothetical protein
MGGTTTGGIRIILRLEGLGVLILALLPVPILLDAGILWLAHIGFDRSLGYGLKYSSGFKHTHLGILGGRKISAAIP